MDKPRYYLLTTGRRSSGAGVPLYELREEGGRVATSGTREHIYMVAANFGSHVAVHIYNCDSGHPVFEPQWVSNDRNIIDEFVEKARHASEIARRGIFPVIATSQLGEFYGRLKSHAKDDGITLC
jgi:hypothetical protein